jgi:dTDP-4-dehydrorhamnose 3,5-epimerase
LNDNWKTYIDDLVIITPKSFKTRGYFFEGYNQAKFHENGMKYDFIQDNQSFSKEGWLEGYTCRLILCSSKVGKCFRRRDSDSCRFTQNSATFGKHFSVVLSAENKKQLMVRMVSHGFRFWAKHQWFIK